MSKKSMSPNSNRCAQHLNLIAARRTQDRLSYLPLVVMALTRVLESFPQCNVLYDAARGVLVRHRAVHVGIATQTPDGLKVPVVRNAQALGPVGSRRRNPPACRARAQRTRRRARNWSGPPSRSPASASSAASPRRPSSMRPKWPSSGSTRPSSGPSFIRARSSCAES